ncbi:MFS transporter [uncultured Stenotrophomonas sp.]|uniref:MFS transporter n=1 Tax=uncultured Stenotrophomonas sp. TaxID=165438 RepID=UPI0025E39893|nr:MFS transporter [uncultured Stenotrophomonas sp.]
MANAYRALFAAPGTSGFALAGLLARLPLPMTGIGIITLLAQLRGSYALAGAVSATFVLVYALASPQISRWVDRHGQATVLPLASAASVVGMLLLLLASYWQAPDWLLFPCAALAGCMPSMSAMVRARWTALYRGQPQLQTAYSLETVFDEMSFIAGPPLSVGLCVGLFPQAGVLLAALLLAVGTVALAMQRATQPQLVPHAAGQPNRSVMALAEVRLLALLMVAMGMIVGTIDITSVAFAELLGQPLAASIVLSAYALGSCAAGLAFGALKFDAPLHRLLLWGGAATALTTLPLLLVASLPALAASVLLAGMFFAPTMIVVMSLVERAVPDQQLTEGMTWLLAGLNIGVALGAAATGQLVDLAGAQAGFAISVGAGAAVLLLSIWVSRRLRPCQQQSTCVC